MQPIFFRAGDYKNESSTVMAMRPNCPQVFCDDYNEENTSEAGDECGEIGDDLLARGPYDTGHPCSTLDDVFSGTQPFFPAEEAEANGADDSEAIEPELQALIENATDKVRRCSNKEDRISKTVDEENILPLSQSPRCTSPLLDNQSSI